MNTIEFANGSRIAIPDLEITVPTAAGQSFNLVVIDAWRKARPMSRKQRLRWRRLQRRKGWYFSGKATGKREFSNWMMKDLALDP